MSAVNTPSTMEGFFKQTYPKKIKRKVRCLLKKIKKGKKNGP